MNLDLYGGQQRRTPRDKTPGYQKTEPHVLKASQLEAESETRRERWELARLQRADRVHELAQAGHTPDAIAAALNLPLSRVHKILADS